MTLISDILKQLLVSDVINWRFVLIDVMTWLLTALPILGAGIGLPKFGTEAIDSLSKDVGRKRSKRVLQHIANADNKQEATDQIIQIIDKAENNGGNIRKDH